MTVATASGENSTPVKGDGCPLLTGEMTGGGVGAASGAVTVTAGAGVAAGGSAQAGTDVAVIVATSRVAIALFMGTSLRRHLDDESEFAGSEVSESLRVIAVLLDDLVLLLRLLLCQLRLSIGVLLLDLGELRLVLLQLLLVLGLLVLARLGDLVDLRLVRLVELVDQRHVLALHVPDPAVADGEDHDEEEGLPVGLDEVPDAGENGHVTSQLGLFSAFLRASMAAFAASSFGSILGVSTMSGISMFNECSLSFLKMSCCTPHICWIMWWCTAWL